MIPWNVIIMVLGVGILMNVISLSGGIDIMVDGLESVMGPKTAATIMAIAAGLCPSSAPVSVSYSRP